MNAQDVKYLLQCIKKDNHAIVCAYLRQYLGKGEKYYWNAIERLVKKDPDLLGQYLSSEDTIHAFTQHDLPHPKSKPKGDEQVA